MSEFNDASTVALLRRAMTQAAARQIVSASNLANVNTPGYRAREATFSDTLDAELHLTHANHLPAPEDVTRRTAEVQGLASRRDGNNVQIDRELLEMTRAGGEFARAQTALAAKFRLVRYAISEGR